MRTLATFCTAVALLATGAAPAAAAKDPDGAYTGKNVKLRVGNDGRQMTKFRLSMSAFCVGLTPDANRLVIAFAALPKVKIAKSGRFAGTYKTGRTEIKYEGRRRGRSIKGEIKLAYPTCSGRRKFEAKRTGR